MVGRSGGIWTELVLEFLEMCKRWESFLDGAFCSCSGDREAVEAFDNLRRRFSGRLGGVVRWVDGAGIGSLSPAKLGGFMISSVFVSVRIKVISGGGTGVSDAGDNSGASCKPFSFFFRRSLRVMALSLFKLLVRPDGTTCHCY